MGKRTRWVGLAVCSLGVLVMAVAVGAQNADVPKVDNVVLLSPQPFTNDKDVIWYDSFDNDASLAQYAEKGGTLTEKVCLGDKGRSLENFYQAGKKGGGTGGRKLVFGDCPIYSNKALRRGEKFEDVYWRMYVKLPKDWQGGNPAKLSRAISFAGPKWEEAMICHVWGGLTLDPASGVKGDQVVTTTYNDFQNLKWLGNNPGSIMRIYDPDQVGRWVCVEAEARLNTPGKSDGYCALWLDGTLQAERRNMNFRGSYTGHTINAVFVEAYWNNGAPVDEYRWIDDFVVSTKPIGPAYCDVNPTIGKTEYTGPGTQSGWEAEIAMQSDKGAVLNDAVLGKPVKGEVIWQSKTVNGDGLTVKVDANTGKFVGVLGMASKTSLAPGHVYFCRVRQKGTTGDWSDWSTWQQPFQTK